MLGTVAEWHSSAVGRLTEPASCRDVQQKGGSDVREGREGTRELARICTPGLPLWEQELLGFGYSGKEGPIAPHKQKRVGGSLQVPKRSKTGKSCSTAISDRVIFNCLSGAMRNLESCL